MRRPYIFLLPILLGQCLDGSMPGGSTPARNQQIIIASTPVALDTSYPGRRRVGALRFLGGWHLTSDTRAFGGFSALDVDGNIVTALGDGGTIVRFRLGRFGNASDASIVTLPNGCGKVLRKNDNDSEALAHDAARKNWWVSYEWRNAICRTNADFTIGEATRNPPTMAAWPRKKGPESMTRLADGRFVVIAEDAADSGKIQPLVVFDRDPTDPAAVATTLGYRAPDGFKPTEIAELPDGRLLVLNRRFTLTSLFSIEVVLLPRLGEMPTGVLQGPTIARFQSPVIADNFEGLSVGTENGRTIIWMISDDNFMRWQRTLLLKFALD